MTIVIGALIIIGVLLLLAVLCWGVRWLERNVPLERYDERQNLARGNAFRVSFWVGMLWYAAAMLCAAGDMLPVDDWLLIYGGVMLQIMVFHIYCLMSGSALPLSAKPLPTTLSYAILGVGQLWDTLTNMWVREMPLTGRGSNVWFHLTAAVCFFSLASMHLIQYFWERREAE